MKRRQRKQQPPAPVESFSDLVEITAWLGTYRERLKLATGRDRVVLEGEVERWHRQLEQRRAELA